MKRDWEENEIKGLFHELRREDERLSPPFARDWEAALRGREKARQPGSLLPFAAAAAITLILFGGSVFVFFRHPSKRPVQAEAGPESIASKTQSQPPTVPFFEPPISHLKTSKAGPKQQANRDFQMRKELSKSARRRLPARPRQSVILISQWGSPTDFLLKSPGDQLLKSIPRLGATVGDLKAIMPDENN